MKGDIQIKRTGIILLVVCAAAFSLILTACLSKSPTTMPEPSVNLTTPTTTLVSDDQHPGPKQIAAVDSAELASQIAGFKVIEPSYIPDGYNGGLFIVINQEAGLTGELKPKFNSMQVQRVYKHLNNPNTMILLVQTVHQFSIAGGEPTTLCGRPAERTFTKADPRHDPYDNLTFNWEISGNFFTLSGWPNETLDEAALIKMACSISIN